MALQHDRVSTFIHTPPVQPTRVSPGYPLTLHPSRSPHLSRLIVLRLLRLLLSSQSAPSPRDILKTSLLIIPPTSGWKECLAPGSHLQHCPSLLPLLAPFVVGPHGHAVTCSSRLDLLGYWLSLLYSLVFLTSKLDFKFSSAYMLLFAYSLLLLKYSFYPLLASLFKFCSPFFDPFRPKKWWYTPLSTRFYRLHSLTHHSRSLILIILSPSHSIPSHCIN